MCIPLSSPNALAFHLCHNIVNLSFSLSLWFKYNFRKFSHKQNALLTHLFHSSCHARSKAVVTLVPCLLLHPFQGCDTTIPTVLEQSCQQSLSHLFQRNGIGYYVMDNGTDPYNVQNREINKDVILNDIKTLYNMTNDFLYALGTIEFTGIWERVGELARKVIDNQPKDTIEMFFGLYGIYVK